ncbi:tRNA-splicing endonuclease subunit sen54 N-term-domain-containing protein [Camillea tinctor]|nr:tRNA-splicing endonuclease subunit sen54 N-term-domain-containing protein [Camillea tinctor]
MAFDDDDDPHPATHPATGNSSNPPNDADDDDKPQDFRLFNSTLPARRPQASGRAIRRGEKDFEAHGTRAQEGQLEASREAMHDVLGYTRTHRPPRDHLRGWYFPHRWAHHAETDSGGLFARHRVVVLESDKGSLAHTMGRVVTGADRHAPAALKTWLLPEEALYLVERGSLDLWWPARDIAHVFAGKGEEAGEDAGPYDEEDVPLGVPLSLQAAYALLIGRPGDRGRVPLERYQVYANLRRSGYKVLRATPLSPPAAGARSLWEWLFALLGPAARKSRASPLVGPGLYRSYAQVYARLALVPRHRPSAVTELTPTAITEKAGQEDEEEDPFHVFYHVWNNSAAAASFTKARPPPPDFRVAVVDARTTGPPTLEQMRGLLERGAVFEVPPLNPPSPFAAAATTNPQSSFSGGGAGGGGIGAVYKRLKHGWRNAVVAVVDGGLVSYLRFGEMAFGEERLYERFDAVGLPGGAG